MLNSYVTFYKMKRELYHYKSVRNQKRIYSTQISSIVAFHSWSHSELKQHFFQDLKKNIFYKKGFFLITEYIIFITKTETSYTFSTIIRSVERIRSRLTPNKCYIFKTKGIISRHSFFVT